jgi:hypothetical protein
MGLWADMSEVERVAHSIRHGNNYHLRGSKAGLLEQAAAYNEDRKDPYAGVNIANVVRSQGNDLAAGTEEDRNYLRGAYLRKFQAQFGNSGSFADDDNVDWRNFTAQGFQLTPEEMASIQGTTGTQDDFTFGGSGYNIDDSSPSVGHNGTFRPASNNGGSSGGTSPPPSSERGETTLGQRQSTPFLDSYMKAREASKTEGPVSKTMKKYTE